MADCSSFVFVCACVRLDAFKTGTIHRELRRIASDVKDDETQQFPRESDDYKHLPRISDELSAEI